MRICWPTARPGGHRRVAISGDLGHNQPRVSLGRGRSRFRFCPIGMRLIYKLLSVEAWNEAEAGGTFRGAPIDLADGYIHFSTEAQVAETAAKHFTGQRNLVLLAVDPQHLGTALKWEVSRGGALFPHLYAPLAVADVLWSKPLPLKGDGSHDFAGLLP